MKLVGEQIYIRIYQVADAKDLADLRTRNRDFFQQFTPLLDESFYTVEKQKFIIKQALQKQEEDQLYAFGIFLKTTDELIGDIKLVQILRGALQSCYIGFALDQKHNGKGYMSEAVRLAVHFAFEELKLHRIEAHVMPRNIASIRVLEKVGFEKEGVAKKNVKINGKWEDHQVLAIINENC